MSTMPELAWRLTRMGGRRALLSTGLTALAVAVATLLLQFAVAGNAAFAERAERTEWRSPSPADNGTILIASAIDYYQGHGITRVDLADLGTGTAPPAPPGLDAFPEPGDIWLSPALADLLANVPDTDFINRYEGTVTGTIGNDALTHPGELLAVVGRDADDPAMTTTRLNYDMVSPRTVDGFHDGTADFSYGLYQMLMILATILMVIPVAVFGAAAARLTVARRDERLATLRLIGATPGQVVRLTLVETLLAAFAGAAAGTALWLASTPLFARIPIDGGTWYVADLWAAPLWMIGVALAVPVLVGISAVIGLRGVVISPLGVARRVSTPGLKAIRAVVFAALAIAFVIATQLFGVGGTTMVIIALVLLAGTIAAFNLMGPWVVQILGRLLARTSRGPARMLAARRLVDDPKAAWRTVSGIVLAGFIAGFTAVLPMMIADTRPQATETLVVPVPEDADAETLAAQAETALAGSAEVAVADQAPFFSLTDDQVLVVTTPGDRVEATRTILTAVVPGDPPEREADETIMSNRYIASVRVGVTVVLAVVFATAAISAAVNGIGSVLDRRRTYRLLHLSGTPMEVLDRARAQETLLPLAWLGGSSILFGMLLAAPVAGMVGMEGSGLIILGVTQALGTAAVLAAGAVSKPLLRSAMADVSPRPD